MYAQMLGFASWVTGSRSSAARLTPKLITGLKPAAPVGENRPNTSPAAVTRAIRIRTRIRLLCRDSTALRDTTRVVRHAAWRLSRVRDARTAKESAQEDREDAAAEPDRRTPPRRDFHGEVVTTFHIMGYYSHSLLRTRVACCQAVHPVPGGGAP